MSEEKTEFNAKEIGTELMSRLRSIKDPLDKERTQEQQELGELKTKFKEEIASRRDKIIGLHHRILPIDDLLVDVAQLKKMKGRAAEAFAEQIVKDIEGLSNDGSN